MGPNSAKRTSSEIPAARKACAESGKRSSSASQPRSPPKSPMSEPWLSWVVASDPVLRPEFMLAP